jgi:hypothetical protein
MTLKGMSTLQMWKLYIRHFIVFEAKINLGEIVECGIESKIWYNKFVSHGQS